VKLLVCGYCKDVRALDPELVTRCRCGRTAAKYRDGWHADIWGDDCVLLGLRIDDVQALLAARDLDGSERRTAEVVAHSRAHPRAHYQSGFPE